MNDASIPSRALPKPPPGWIIRAAMAVSRMIEAVGRAMVPPGPLVFRDIFGAAKTEMIGVLCRHRVFDLLDQPQTAETIAARLGFDVDRTFRLLRCAAHFDLLSVSPDLRFSLTRAGRALTSDHPSRARDFAVYFSSRSNFAAWSQLENTLRSDEHGFKLAHGTDVWSWFDAHPDERDTFARAMMGLTLQDAPFVASLYPWQEVQKVCDVGGGRGTLLSELLLRHGHLTAMLVDAPGVLELARTLLAHRGVGERVQLVPGSFFDSVPEGADAYVIKNVLHDWDDATCVRILEVVRRAMKPGQRLVLVEQLLERDDARHFVNVVDMHMMIACVNGRERSRAELRALMERAGFTAGRIFPGPITSVLEGRAV